jgi:hypothetical protein
MPRRIVRTARSVRAPCRIGFIRVFSSEGDPRGSRNPTSFGLASTPLGRIN